MLGFSKGGVGYVLMRTDSLYDEQITMPSGLKVFTDVTYRPERHMRIYGTVVQTPVLMGMTPIAQVGSGFPGYGAIRKYKNHDMDSPSHAFYKIGGTMGYKFMSDIADEVKIGDKVYFKWRVIQTKGNLMAKSSGANPEYIFKVPYDQIICVVRDGKVIPIGSNTLIDPNKESFEETLVPTYYKNPDAQGNRVQKPKDQWIMKKVFPENKERQGTIMHVGTPLLGDDNDLNVGDQVLYKINLRNMFKIEGNDYIVLRQDKLIAKIN